MKKIFEKFGIFGLDKVEDSVLAGLLTGDPVLLVGLHGTAKTLLCSCLAEQMGLKFHAYDASKALFEDIIGIPNPYTLKNGKIEYISTPVSIWDKEFILIDEISRANYSMQNKWLELIRSRTAMGLRADKLKYIFGAMNPPDYPGARTLDPAVAGRFAFIIDLPTFNAMDYESRARILAVTSRDDSVLIEKEEKAQKIDLAGMIERARANFNETEEKYSHVVKRFIFHLSEHLNSNEFYFDGRRAGMMMRNIMALIAVKIYIKNDRDINIERLLKENTQYLLPYRVEREDLDAMVLNKIIEDSVAGLSENEPLRKNIFLTASSFTRELQKVEKEHDLTKRISALLDLKKYEDAEDSNLRNRFYHVWAKMFSITDDSGCDFFKFFKEKERYNSSLLTYEKIRCNAFWIYFALFDEDFRRFDEELIDEISNILSRLIKEENRQ